MLNCGPSMQMTVALAWTVRGGPERTPGGDIALWMAEERGASKGLAMEMWPTMPSSKNVQGRTFLCGKVRHGQRFCILFHPLLQLCIVTVRNITHTLGPVYHTPCHHKIPWLHLLPQTPHSAEPHRGHHAQLFQTCHIRAVVDLMRCILVMETVSR